MLVLTRHPGQRITLQPRASLRPATPIGRVFADGPIEILVSRIEGDRVRIGIKAPADLVIHRAEVGEGRDVVEVDGEAAG
jgi:carbon storage regulator CsrA